MSKQYETVIGLEVHVELATKTKIFCGCSTAFGGAPNTHTCPVCTGMPGSLPVLNKQVVEYAAAVGLATNCSITQHCKFDRKNYFYPDLPKAYQITQFDHPICTGGYITVTGGKDIRINHIHIEEDAGKLVHDDYEGISMADYNRCGVPLIEIVTEPDFRSIEEVQDFVEKLALRLKYAGVCDAKMEQGSMRVDVNISIMPVGSTEFGTRAELKNLNSLKAIGRAIEYEINRQAEILDNGGTVIQETRRYNDNHGDTKALRSKEDAHDYRYFPEPDIPSVFLSDEEIEDIRKSMPEMPQDRFVRYTEKYGLPTDDANLIISSKEFSDFYDESVKINPDYKQISNLMLVELNRNLNDSEKTISDVTFSPADLAELVKMSTDGVVSKNAAKDILKIMFNNGGKPIDIAKENGFIMDNDTSGLEEIIDKIIAENADSVESYKNGNQKIFGFLMGQVVRTAGKGANPKLAKDLLTEKLK